MSDERHVRIDEGIPRGRRPMKAGKPTKPSHPADCGTWKIPEGLDPQEVIRQYLTESKTSGIARQYGLSRHALTDWLLQTVPEDWKKAQRIRALVMKDDGQEKIYSARDALSLARAREITRSAQFDLQALDPDYRPQQAQINVAANGPVQVQIVSFAQQQTDTIAMPQLPNNDAESC